MCFENKRLQKSAAATNLGTSRAAKTTILTTTTTTIIAL